MISEIAPGIFVADHKVAEGKNGILLTNRGAVAIDTGTYPHEGQEMVQFIEQQGYAPNRLIYTHGHGDHVLGSLPFIGAEVISHRLTPLEIKRLLPKWTEMYGVSATKLAARIAQPTITYSDELDLDLGNKRLRLFPTPGHSQDGVSVYVEQDRLLFAGDSVVTAIVPAIGDGDSHILETTLHDLLTLDIEIMVPGHGQVVYGQTQVQNWLQWIIDYLSGVRAAVNLALEAGTSADDVAQQLDYDAFVGQRLAQDKHNMPMRHRNTVAKIIAEELATR